MTWNMFQGSLSQSLDILLGKLGDVSLSTRAYLSWDRWVEVAHSPRAEEFASKLPVAQFNSHRILLELYHGAPDDRNLLSIISQSFRDDAAREEQESQEKDQPEPDLKLPRISHGSDFQKAIFNLFVWEFYCHADFDNTEQWTTLPLVVEWFCVQFIKNNQLYDDNQPVTAKEVQQNKKLVGSMELTELAGTSNATTEGDNFNPWFTSLWTLQEICLRPDMLIASRNWNLLALNGIPVAFDEIVALDNAIRKAENRNVFPKAVTEVKSLLARTGLSHLASMTHLSILGLCDKRFCLERRAEAIMAVMDATEWFGAAKNDQEREQNLVLGYYPLNFVQEVQRKVGSAAFFQSDTVQPYFAEALKNIVAHPEGIDGMGSLLPFGPGVPKSYHEVVWDFQVTPHDSVDSWVIEGSGGSVRIPEAVIVSSSERNYDSEMPSMAMAPVVGDTTRRLVSMQHVNLHEWVNSYEPTFANYAVCLFTSSSVSIGILLKQLRPGVMVKIGTYFQDLGLYKVPNSEKLGWLVL
ncbi:hypothetical protein NW757_010104 [Fusarium falciforme]|nr:hypothetical protein NW757_010104 [Fusarium falciforme]